MRWQSVSSEIHIVCETKKDSVTTGSKHHSTEPTHAKTLLPRQLPSLRGFRCTLCTWHMHRDTLEVSDALQSQCTFLACGAGCCNLWLLKEILYAIARVTVLHIVLVCCWKTGIAEECATVIWYAMTCLHRSLIG